LSKNGQPWLFRVASDPRRGGGHVSRCRTLARVLQKQAPVHFALDEEHGGWRERLLAENFEVVDLDRALGCDYGEGCLLDGYDFDQNYALQLRERLGPLAFMDDKLDPPDCADLIINAGASDGQYGPRRALTGLKYALADTKFSSIERPTSAVETVLITMGLRDAPNATALALQIMAAVAHSGITPKLIIALGSKADHLERVRKLLDQYPGETELHLDVTDMPTLVARADLALVAGGVSMLECLAAGCPSAVLTTADNQTANVDLAKAAGAILPLGDMAAVTIDEAAAAVGTLFQQLDQRRALATSARAAVDGLGPERIAQALTAMRHGAAANHQTLSR
jgi:UDP-2,4-diacetamido-2,4,6-trideoxy-beta-L-altropyranose hydrolase